MKINLNDPRITAFALGELKGQDAVDLARAVRVDGRVRAAVDAARETSSLLLGTLGDGETYMLTATQRDAVRSAAGMADTTNLTVGEPRSAAFWKNPAVAGIGVAAVVALTLYIVMGRPAGGDVRSKVADDANTKSLWNWSQVDMDDLNAPAVVDRSNDGQIKQGSEPSQAISAAISEDTTSYRKELERRIKESGLEKAGDLPELEDGGWQDVSVGHQFHIPLASGAASWPWLKRYIDEQKERPPRQAIRIEEMVNYFHYKSPGMIKGRGLAADMELCTTPWNPHSLLLAINVKALPGVLASDAEGASASLVVNSERIKRMRILGYSPIKSTAVAADDTGQPQRQQGLAMQVSRSRGNYIIYELMPADDVDIDVDSDIPMVTLSLGGDENLPSGRIVSWIHASADLRFASMVTASGMLLAGTSSASELDTDRLKSLLDLLEKQDGSTFDADRRDALKIIRQASVILDASRVNDQ